MNNTIMRGFFIPAAVLLLTASPLLSGTDDGEEKKERLDSIVVSASRAAASSPVTFTMVSGERLRSANAINSLPMNLSLQPSVVSWNEGGTGLGNSSMTVRGVKGSQINVTLNGITLNDAESQEVFWVNIPALTGLLSSVQLQRGLGTSASGAGAFGASVNMSTASVGATPSGAAECSYGSWHTAMTSVAAASGLTRSGLYASFAWAGGRTDGYIRNAGVRSQSFFGVLGWLRGHHSLRLTYLYGKQKSGITWDGIDPETYATDRRSNPAGAYLDDDGKTCFYDNQTDNYRQHHLQLNYAVQLTDALSWTSTLDYTRGDGYDEYYKTGRKFAEFGFPSPMTGVDGAAYRKSDMIYRKAMGNDLYAFKSDLHYRGASLDLTGGVYASRYDGDHWGEVLWARVLEMRPVTGSPDWAERLSHTRFDYASLNEADAWYRNSGRKWDLSAFIRGTYALSQAWTAYADLQLRGIDYSLRGRDDKASDIPMDYHNTWVFFNPRVGLTFRPSTPHKFYASSAVGHREPGRGDIKENIKGELLPIRPESMLDVEAGYAYEGTAFSSSANLYLMEYKDMLLETGRLSSSGYAIKENIGRGFRRGIELVAAGRPAQWVTIEANTTFSINKIRSFTAYLEDWVNGGYRPETYTHTTMLLSPSVIGMGALTLLPFPHSASSLRTTRLTLSGKYVGRQYWDNTQHEDRCVPAFFVTDLVLSHAFTLPYGTLGLSCYVNNLLDREYYASAWVYRAWDGQEYQEAGLYPQATRNMFLKVSWRF